MLYKNTLIKIKKSFGRYISLFIIVMVGVGFYAGIQSSAPDISKVADRYYDGSQMMDFKIVNSMGLTEEDVGALKSFNHVNAAIGSYSLDVLEEDKAIRVHALEDAVNTIKLTSGRMPENDTECVADSKNYQIGDKISIASDVKDKMKNTDFTVVGVAESVLYIADDYGNTTVGDGQLSSFIFVPKDNFILEAYTEIYVVLDGATDRMEYSKAYDELALAVHDELVKIKPDRENARFNEIYNKANDELSENEAKLNDEKAKGEKELADAKAELDDNAKKLKDGKAELDRNESDLQDTVKKQNAEFDTAKAKIADGWKEIDAALSQSGLKKEELGSRVIELNQAIESMKAQLSAVPAGGQEYAQLSATIAGYSKQYEGLVKLKESADTLTVQETQLNEGIEAFNSEIAKAKAEIEKGKSEIAENEKKLNDGYDEYNKNLKKFNTEIADAQTKIADAKKDLSGMEHPKWYIFDRDVAAGYTELKSQIDVITSIAAVFPFFFILIAMLMTSNTAARMIAEERSELGTLTSLGYKDRSIIFTYLLYVLSASGLGAIAGFFMGCRVLPPLVYSNFRFILPPLTLHYDFILLLIIMAVTLTLMSAVTLVACNRELRQKPATLMRPLPPKHGQKILLERMGIIWNHLSFTWKVTMRNMFRYKKRAFMTIVGVAGCASLLLVGFGLRDSMNGVVERQYGEMFRYNDMIVLKDEVQNLNKDLESLFAKEQITNPLLIRQTSVKCETGGKTLNTFLIVPEDIDGFYDYYDLNSTISKEKISLSDSGVVITQKISEAFKAGKGDSITIKDADNNVYTLTVADVAENYTSNYIYMNSTQYNKVFQKTAVFNTVISRHNATDEKILAEHLMDSDLVLNVVFTGDIMQKALDSNQNLDSIIILLVLVASLLAIVVLYNLTSINISERTREIATLKVLGFRDGETNSYIYREAFVLTLFSVGIGMVSGVVLHRFVVGVIEGTSMVLIKNIEWMSFVLASLMTILFSLIMQVITYFKLKTIDMIESLKSVE